METKEIKEIKEILLIGNGFDLAHKLPTQYKDFLEFCEKINTIYATDENLGSEGYWNSHLGSWEFDFTISSNLEMAFTERHNNKINAQNSDKCIIDELYALIENNTWINYFINRRGSIKENWIDFETEIANVIRVLDGTRKIMENEGLLSELGRKRYEIFDEISDILAEKEINIDSEEEIDKAIKVLTADLNRLTRALEIYLAEFVSKIDNKIKIPEIEELVPDHILSFNYTNTYEKIYGIEKNIEYDYIHGEASVDKNVESCNLVLGIDEYLLDDRKNKDIEFVTFKKYYQRIYKGTGCKYLDWVSVIKDKYIMLQKNKEEAYDRVNKMLVNGNKNEKIFNKSVAVLDKKPKKYNLYIFGHSLDVTDKDIIKSFICNDNVYTKIFYYRETEDDKRTLGRLITNLIKVIGQDELIKRTGGPNKTIEFVPQKVNEKRLEETV